MSLQILPLERFRVPGNMERRVLHQAGYYRGLMMFFRFIGRIFK
jgi:hypothetical protein